jgi:hypothetical protein
VSKADFSRVGKRIDAWLERISSDCPWLKTSFPKGLSHFLYGAYLDANDPWACSVQFGRIADKHVYRDICRFWRLLLIDLFPECPQMLELFTDFFEYMELVLRLASTDESLRVAEVGRVPRERLLHGTPRDPTPCSGDPTGPHAVLSRRAAYYGRCIERLGRRRRCASSARRSSRG